MHLEYDICVRLKDAGFPQNTQWAFVGGAPWAKDYKGTVQLMRSDKDSDSYVNLLSAGYTDIFSVPTLEELITECVKLSVQGDFHLEKNPEVELWGASIDCFKDDPYINGKTAIEAVANLYLHLSLHKKDI